MTDAALEPVAAESAAADTAAADTAAQSGLRSAAAAMFGAMAEQIAENSDARLREDVAEMLEEADAAALESADADAEAAKEAAEADKRREAQGEGAQAQPQANAEPLQGRQSAQADMLLSPAGLSAYAAAQSAMIAPTDGEGYDTPADDVHGALAEAAAI